VSRLKECKTTCPYCGVGCGIVAKFNEQGLISVEGDPGHPANKGRLCSKGSALAETMSDTTRLRDPIVNGKVSDWNETLDLIASKFRDAISNFGSDSVAFYVSGQLLTEDYYVANKLMKGFIGSANIDTNSRLCMASSVAGYKRAFGSDTVPVSYEDLECSDLVVLVGSNLAWCHPVLYQRLAAAKEQRPNLKIVVIDPRKTMTTDIADLHLAIDPDGDAALFMGLFAHLQKTGACDDGFIARHTNGFDETLKQCVPLTIEEIAKKSGLDPADIISFYELYRTTQKTVTVYSQGVNQSRVGTDKVNAILNCHLITGRIGKPGTGPFSITGQPNAMGGREVGGLSNMLAAHMELDNPDHRNQVKSFWKAPHLPERPGLKAVDLFKAVDKGDIKVLWIMATNPVDSLPDSDFIKEALNKCPFVIVSDIYENTDTNAFAHVLLPSSGWGEKNGTVTNSERRISRQRGFLRAPGNAKPDWWQMAAIGKRLGYHGAFDYLNEADIYREHAALSALDNNGSRDFDIGEHSKLSNDGYDNLAPVRWPVPIKKNLSERPFFSDGHFFTADKKANIIPVTMPTTDLETGPYQLNTGRIRDQWHTMTRTGRSPRLSAHLSEPFAEIHPVDAQKLGIESDDIVELTNKHGRLLANAMITFRQKKGQVFVPMHWTDQYASNGRVNSLIPSITDPVSGQPASKNTGVSIRKYEAKTFVFLLTREKPVLPTRGYWASFETEGGWATEFAGKEDLFEILDVMKKMLNVDRRTAPLVYADKKRGEYRLALFHSQRLEGILYAAGAPLSVSRSWLCSKFEDDFNDPMTRYTVVAGKAPVNEIDKGAIICSCFGVGSNEIADAVRSGCFSVEAVGNATQAGSNCGSCRSEIKELINKNALVAAQ
jgi:assimilatory nitrate reductase catalytic subunit